MFTKLIMLRCRFFSDEHEMYESNSVRALYAAAPTISIGTLKAPETHGKQSTA